MENENIMACEVVNGEEFLNAFFEKLEDFCKRNEINEINWLEKFKSSVNSLDESGKIEFINMLEKERFPF